MRTDYYVDTIGKKIAKILYDYGFNGEMDFDKEYCSKGLPYLTIDGVKYDIYRFYINEEGNEVTITTLKADCWWVYTFYLDYRKDDDEYERFFCNSRKEYDNYIRSWGVYGLFSDLLAYIYEATYKDRNVLRLQSQCLELSFWTKANITNGKSKE